MKKMIIALLVVLSLSGCANLKFQWAASYKTDNLAGALEDVVSRGQAEIATAPAKAATK